ncbi:LysR family transcriptional regulator [Paracoccus litorisediminis]|uniref:LysR family transcriptional regulator n=1 Tax=Paracoccus litorisediminis TaxID=2006130 RepID=A0A844HRW1_9RHOB|nr:LysR family transcriptional regulator [Paracoccus litorisediminis]MTH61808.1 LysR family transcriptional regulator [Paracoccus litorisediminis]
MLNLKPLHHFVLVVEERNFAAAARRANISQPALSNSIRTLEEQIGMQLFLRDERPVKVTPEGEEILERARWLLFEARNLDVQISALRSGVAGHLRCGMVPIFSASFGGNVFAAFSRRSPQTTFEADVGQTSQLLQLLDAEEIEVAICDFREIPSDSSYEVTRLPPKDGACYCRTDHPILTAGTLTGPMIHEYGIASVRIPQELHDDLRRVFMPGNSIDPLLHLQCDNVTLLIDTVRQSDLILLTSRQSAQAAVAGRLLVEVPYPVSGGSEWCIVALRNKVLRPAARELVETVKAECA